MWIECPSSICGEHVWADGERSNGELNEENNETPLAKKTQAMDLLREIVIDRTFMDHLKFYTRFR